MPTLQTQDLPSHQN